jgi:hypothetical protein
MHGSKLRWRCVAYTCWLLVAHSFAQAQGQAQSQSTNQSSDTTTNSFDGFIESALQAYDAGRFAEARTAFRRAHAIQPTARTLRTIGMCSFNLGDYADAVENLEASLTDQRKPLTDEHRKHAQDLINRANPHIGRFHLRLTPAEASLTVDGQAPLMIGHSELLLEAGRHEIDVQAPGFRGTQSVLDVDGGDRTTLEVRLTPAPEGIAAGGSNLSEASAPAASTRASGQKSHPASVQTTVGYVSLGVGVASLIGFGVVSGLALSEKSKLDDRCGAHTCGPSHFDEVDRYDTLRTASTVTLIAGGVFAATGAVLLLMRHGDREREHARFTPLIGPGAIGLRGEL